jgi:peptide-methionine (S)-S-oxide reductase
MVITVRKILLVVGLLFIGWKLYAVEAPLPTLPKPALELAPAKPGESRTIILAGGCFWCEEALFEQLKGVSSVVAGYAGGTQETATYDRYTESNHAEAVKITYDPQSIGYAELIRVLMTVGDPTTKDGQDPDYGHQYRMAVFYTTAEEKHVAEAYIAQVAEAKVFSKPLEITVESMPHGFFPAEEYHQHYVAGHRDAPYCRLYSLAKIRKVRAAFANELKPTDPTAPAP